MVMDSGGSVKIELPCKIKGDETLLSVLVKPTLSLVPLKLKVSALNPAPLPFVHQISIRSPLAAKLFGGKVFIFYKLQNSGIALAHVVRYLRHAFKGSSLIASHSRHLLSSSVFRFFAFEFRGAFLNLKCWV